MADNDPGGEPWWVVVARVSDGDLVRATVDAPTAEDATAEAQRSITIYEGEPPSAHLRTTGPFPTLVRTEERERRPVYCGGCGLSVYCGNHPPTPEQTWFEEKDWVGYDQLGFECINCGTLTWLPAGGRQAIPPRP